MWNSHSNEFIKSTNRNDAIDLLDQEIHAPPSYIKRSVSRAANIESKKHENPLEPLEQVEIELIDTFVFFFFRNRLYSF